MTSQITMTRHTRGRDVDNYTLRFPSGRLEPVQLSADVAEHLRLQRGYVFIDETA